MKLKISSTKKIIKIFFKKFPFKLWKVYVCKKDIIDFLINNPAFKESEIKRFILFTIESPDESHIIAADPFIHDENTILYESISKKTGNGNIFKYDIVKNKNSLICLQENKHYSFPRTLKIKDKYFFTCESADCKGLCIFITDKEINFLKEVNKSNISEDLNFHIIDPILFLFEDKLKCYCTTLEYGNCLLLNFESNYCDSLNFKLINKVKLSKNLKENITLRLAGMLSLNHKEYLATQNHNKIYGSSLNLINLNSLETEKINLIHESNIFSHINSKEFIGPHTINKSKDSSIIVMDLANLSWINIPLKFKHFLSKYLKKII
tara:strand:+ start:7928 stop:8893 length:966 start_codon:yes stop_codon:yes gene_type:complete